MSYCRFSSDDWKSDVYIYEADYGYVCHVASSRHVGNIPPLLPWDENNIEAYFRRYDEQVEAVSGCKLVKIGGDYDGDHVVFDSLLELRDFLVKIAAAGYHVPAFAMEAIKYEIAEEAAM